MKQKNKFERMNYTMKKLKVRKGKKSIAWLLTVAMVITMFSGMSIGVFGEEDNSNYYEIIGVDEPPILVKGSTLYEIMVVVEDVDLTSELNYNDTVEIEIDSQLIRGSIAGRQYNQIDDGWDYNGTYILIEPQNDILLSDFLEYETGNLTLFYNYDSQSNSFSSSQIVDFDGFTANPNEYDLSVYIQGELPTSNYSMVKFHNTNTSFTNSQQDIQSINYDSNMDQTQLLIRLETYEEYESIDLQTAQLQLIYDYGFQLDNSTSNSIDFYWNEIADADEIKIQIEGPHTDYQWEDASVENLTNSSATVINLDPDTGYRFRLVVIGGIAAGESAPVWYYLSGEDYNGEGSGDIGEEDPYFDIRVGNFYERYVDLYLTYSDNFLSQINNLRVEIYDYTLDPSEAIRAIDIDKDIEYTDNYEIYLYGSETNLYLYFYQNPLSLVAQNTYEFRIYDADTETLLGNAYSTFTPPFYFSYNAVSENELEIQWQTVPGVNQFRLEIYDNEEQEILETRIVNQSDTFSDDLGENSINIISENFVNDREYLFSLYDNEEEILLVYSYLYFEFYLPLPDPFLFKKVGENYELISQVQLEGIDNKMLEINGDLYFYSSNSLFKLNGSELETVNIGINIWIDKIVEYENSLYISAYDNNDDEFVLKFDGTTIEEFSFIPSIMQIFKYKNEEYILSVNSLYILNNTTLEQVSLGNLDSIYQVSVTNDYLYIRGMDSEDQESVVMWDGEITTNIPLTGINFVQTIFMYDGELYIQGFDDEWNLATLKWNSTESQTELVSSFNILNLSFFEYENELYFNGVNPQIYELLLAKWDGQSITEIFTDLQIGTKILGIYNNEFYFYGQPPEGSTSNEENGEENGEEGNEEGNGEENGETSGTPMYQPEKIIPNFNYISEYTSYAREKNSTLKAEKKTRLDDHHVNFVTKMVLPKKDGGDLTNLNAYNQFQLAEKYAQRIIDETLSNQVMEDLTSLAEITVNTYDEALDSGVPSIRRGTFEKRRNQLAKSVGLAIRNFGSGGSGGGGKQQGSSTGPIPGTLLNIPVGGGYTFLGEVTTDQLFEPGKTILDYFDPTGTNFNTTTNYLKFENTDGTVLFVAKTPVKHSISWDAINGGNSTQDPSNVNSGVYGAMQRIINGETYKIRLLTGGNDNPASSAGGEWDHLLVALVNAGIGYTDATLITYYEDGDGSASWTQEQFGPHSSRRVHRGDIGVSNFDYNNSSDMGSDSGWRPALELVP
jgi:hypothetical protein